MPYPTMRRSDASMYLKSDPTGKNGLPVPDTHHNDPGEDVDWDTKGQEICKRMLAALAVSTSGKGAAKGRDFEAFASPEMHQLMPEHPAVADPEFWIWLAVRHCVDLIGRRYPGKRNLANFGVGSVSENLLFRLWLRGEIAYESGAADEYGTARIGDVDFWRSHIFRQRYGGVPVFARALVKFQFPAAAKHKPRLKIPQIRALAKGLKRARSNLVFEVMNEAQALAFITAEWERLAQEIA